MLIKRLTMEHWHLIPGGIEFEDDAGDFVHVMMTEEQWRQLALHITSVPRRPALATTSARDARKGY